MPGPPVNDHYGLDLAEAVGFPSSVLENAKCIVEGIVLLQSFRLAFEFGFLIFIFI